MANVLILGATSKVAGEVARLLKQRGARLFLVARNAERLACLVDELAPVGHYCCDLSDPTNHDGMLCAVRRAMPTIDHVLIAYGYLGDQLASERDYREAEAMIRINFSSVVALLIPLLNQLETQGKGALTAITSVAGDRGRPRNYTYGAAKGALSLYLQGARSRLWKRGVRIHTIKMGPVDTPMTATHKKDFSFIDARRAARLIVHHMQGRGGVHYVPGFWRWVMLVVRNMPEPLFQRLRFLSGR